MTPLEKLLQRVSEKDRDAILSVIERIVSGETTFRVEKLAESDLYKVRKGNFRFIFHYERNKIVIDAVRLRNEKTYRDV